MGINDVGGEFTCSTLFLLPAIGLQRKDILKYGFIDAYLDDVNHDPLYKASLHLLFKPENMDAFQIFLDKEYKRTKSLVDDYDYAGGYVVALYQIPEEFRPEYDLFLKGKYSRFRKKYMQLFPKMVEVRSEDGKVTNELSLAYHIFNKTQPIRDYWEDKLETRLDEDAELWSKPDIEGAETLDIYNRIKR